MKGTAGCVVLVNTDQWMNNAVTKGVYKINSDVNNWLALIKMLISKIKKDEYWLD